MKTVKKALCLFLCFVLTASFCTVFVKAGEIVTILLGDMDMDGTVSVDDARIILRVSVGLEKLNVDLAEISANTDKKGGITVEDARIALRVAVGLEKAQTIDVDIESNTPQATKGTFVFTTYGYGHGVGMSQLGADYYAKQGWSYKQILSHYYTGIAYSKDTVTSSQKISLGSTTYTLREGIARILEMELGPSYHTNARKAQAVAIYTFLKYRNSDKSSADVWSSNGVAYIDSSRQYSSSTMTVVDSVLGEYMTYNGKAINAVFSCASAGTTASSATIWGGNLPYLQPVDSIGDTETSYYGKTYELSSSKVKELLTEDYGSSITLSKYPSEWFEIISQDGAVSVDDGIGYISKMRAGNLYKTGEQIRIALGLKSPCFVIEFIAE